MRRGLALLVVMVIALATAHSAPETVGAAPQQAPIKIGVVMDQTGAASCYSEESLTISTGLIRRGAK